MQKENLGPAERIINTILAYSDHMVHNRPGVVSPDPTSATGVKWVFVTHKTEDGKKVVYALDKVGKKTIRRKLGVMGEDRKVRDDANRVIGEYRDAGIFPEVATWLYGQVAEVWKIDHEFAARWASYQYAQEHRDMKAVLAAFMLVQSRKGDPVIDDGKVAFYDEDFRDVGEAMMLRYKKGDKHGLRPKDLLRIRDVLMVPGVADINRKLGFGKSARKPFLGRWEKAVEKWLKFREVNPKMLEGLIKEGYKSTVMQLAQLIGYKPESDKFFHALGWKQVQAKDGRRGLAIGQVQSGTDSWEGMSEAEVCEKIVKEKTGFKRLIGLVPKEVGMTRAVIAAAIEAGSLSDKDLVIMSATLEELGLLQDPDVRKRWEKALKAAEDMRAANIASRVKSKDVQEKLQEAADTAVQKAVEEVSRDMRVYFMVDISGSMEGAIEAAKDHVAKFLQAFPEDKIHVSVFNTIGREVKVKHRSAAGVKNAFEGIRAEGGTSYAAGVRALQGHKPLANEDVLFIFIGDEQDNTELAGTIRASGLNPMAFGLVPVFAKHYGRGNRVTTAASELKIPCFEIDEKTFADPYAIPRAIRALIAATPVNRSPEKIVQRVSLVENILKTDLITKPEWAA